METIVTRKGWTITLHSNRQGCIDGYRAHYSRAQLRSLGIGETYHKPDGSDIALGANNAEYLLARMQPARVLAKGVKVA